MSTHTPGPWSVEYPYGEHGCYVTAANPRTTNPLICKMMPENADPNARLIAAAPDLLAFAQLVRDFFTDDSIGHAQYLKEQAESAIDKAEGR